MHEKGDLFVDSFALCSVRSRVHSYTNFSPMSRFVIYFSMVLSTDGDFYGQGWEENLHPPHLIHHFRIKKKQEVGWRSAQRVL